MKVIIKISEIIGYMSIISVVFNTALAAAGLLLSIIMYIVLNILYYSKKENKNDI